MISYSDGGGAKDLSVLMIPVDYTNRSQDGSNSKLEIMGMLLKVRGSYLEQLRQQVINCTKKETEKKEFQVKIQLDNLHYSKSPAGPGIHLCGASTNELGCSGLNIQTNCKHLIFNMSCATCLVVCQWWRDELFY